MVSPTLFFNYTLRGCCRSNEGVCKVTDGCLGVALHCQVALEEVVLVDFCQLSILPLLKQDDHTCGTTLHKPIDVSSMTEEQERHVVRQV